MKLPDDDLAAPARVVSMWELARARRKRDAGEASLPSYGGNTVGLDFDIIPRMSPEERDVQKYRWMATGEPLPEDDEFPINRTWDALQNDLRKKDLECWDLERILSRSGEVKRRRVEGNGRSGSMREYGPMNAEVCDIGGVRPFLKRLITLMNGYTLISRCSRLVARRYLRKIEDLAYRNPRPDLSLLITADRRARRYWRREVVDNGKTLDEAIMASIVVRNDIWTEEVTTPSSGTQCSCRSINREFCHLLSPHT